MDDPHTLRVWSAVTFIVLGAAEILIVSTIYAIKRELRVALDRLAVDFPDRPGVSAVARLIYGAGFFVIRHTGLAYAVGAFSVGLGTVILILEELYGG